MINEKVAILVHLLRISRYREIDLKNLCFIVDKVWFELKLNEGKHVFYMNPYYVNNNEIKN